MCTVLTYSLKKILGRYRFFCVFPIETTMTVLPQNTSEVGSETY